MDHELNSEGICCTCSLRSNCLSFKNSKISGRPIVHCEEFEEFIRHAAGETQRAVAIQSNFGDTRVDLVDCPSAKGLCINCEDAEICKFADLGDEVIFCEEHSSNFEFARRARVSHGIFTDVPNLVPKNLIPGWDE